MEIHIEAAGFRIAHVLDEEQEGDIGRVEAGDLQLLDPGAIRGGVQAHGPIEQVALQPDLVAGQFVRLRGGGHGVVLIHARLVGRKQAGVTVLSGRAIALGKVREQHHVVRRRPFQRRLENDIVLHQGTVRLKPGQVDMPGLDPIQRLLVAAAAPEQVSGRAVVAVRAPGIQDDVVVAAVVVLPQGLEAVADIIAEISAVATPVRRLLGIAADAVAAAEGEIGGALQLGSQVIVTGAHGHGHAVGDIESELAEDRPLLFRAGEVVEIDGGRRARTERIDTRCG